MERKNLNEEQSKIVHSNNDDEQTSEGVELRRLNSKLNPENEAERYPNDLTTARSKWSYLRNEDLLGQRYEEYANVPPKRLHSKITWDRIKQIQEVPNFGHKRTYEKRSDRSRPNPWRRYGALLKLHEIGGWASKIDRQQSSRRNRKYYYVRPGSKPCNPPNRPPITVRESKIIPTSAITIPQCETIEQVASAVGLQLQVLMRANSQEKLTHSFNIDASMDIQKTQSASHSIKSTQNNVHKLVESSANSTINNNVGNNVLPTRWTDNTTRQIRDYEIQMERLERIRSNRSTNSLPPSSTLRLSTSEIKRCGTSLPPRKHH